jgi:hypothetical protein
MRLSQTETKSVVVHIAGDVGTTAAAAMGDVQVVHTPGDEGHSLPTAEVHSLPTVEVHSLPQVGVAHIVGDAGTIAAAAVEGAQVVHMPGDAGLRQRCRPTVVRLVSLFGLLVNALGKGCVAKLAGHGPAATDAHIEGALVLKENGFA